MREEFKGCEILMTVYVNEIDKLLKSITILRGRCLILIKLSYVVQQCIVLEFITFITSTLVTGRHVVFDTVTSTRP